ncbi:MAG: hypothetical protein ACRCX2_19440 [Paraclostridium sp.]
MYYLVGKRISGQDIRKKYNDINVAKFEFDATKCVSEYLVLSEENTGYKQLDIYVKG